jgi:hypothetical protein
LAEVEVEAPPMAVLLAQQAFAAFGQALAVAAGVATPALADVDVELPPMAVLLAQQAFAAPAFWQDLCEEAAAGALSVATVVAALSDCADAWLEIINPPITRPQTIKN